MRSLDEFCPVPSLTAKYMVTCARVGDMVPCARVQGSVVVAANSSILPRVYGTWVEQDMCLLALSQSNLPLSDARRAIPSRSYSTSK